MRNIFVGGLLEKDLSQELWGKNGLITNHNPLKVPAMDIQSRNVQGQCLEEQSQDLGLRIASRMAFLCGGKSSNYCHPLEGMID